MPRVKGYTRVVRGKRVRVRAIQDGAQGADAVAR